MSRRLRDDRAFMRASPSPTAPRVSAAIVPRVRLTIGINGFHVSHDRLSMRRIIGGICYLSSLYRRCAPEGSRISDAKPLAGQPDGEKRSGLAVISAQA